MQEPRREEAWANACISSALGAEVQHHDDGSGPSMHDLEIAHADGSRAAIEVTTAADPAPTELWNLIGGRWILPGIAGGWTIGVRPQARASTLRSRLPTLLRVLESQGVQRVWPAWTPGPCDGVAASLGIAHLLRGPTAFPGSVYPTIDEGPEKTGGFVAQSGNPLAEWLGRWVADPARADNLSKLGRSGAAERHLFVVMPPFVDAPFAVVDLLMRDDAPLPVADPVLPEEVTHAWVASTWTSGSGMRWSRAWGWQRFAKWPGKSDAKLERIRYRSPRD
jgi:hypothetical protein